MRWALALALGLAGAMGALWWQERTSRLGAEGRLAAAGGRVEPVPVAAAPVEAAAVTAEVGSKRVERGTKLPLPTEYIRVIEETRAALEASKREISAARNEIEGLKEKLEKDREERERLAAELADGKETLAGVRRVVAATEAELKAKNERLVRLETSEKLVREAAGKAEVNAARAMRTGQELEQLNQRREVLLASIVRRYREVTDQYRTLSLRVQSRAEQLGLDPGAGELSRIQSSVQQAEEEMRQLNSLSAQAAKVLRGGK